MVTFAVILAFVVGFLAGAIGHAAMTERIEDEQAQALAKFEERYVSRPVARTTKE